MNKVCTKCKKIKPRNAFYPESICADCERARKRLEYRKAKRINIKIKNNLIK